MKLFTTILLPALAIASTNAAGLATKKRPVATLDNGADAAGTTAAGRGRAFIEGQRGLFGTGTRTSMYDMQAMDQTCWCDIYCQELKDFSDDYDELCAAAPTDSPVPTLSPSKNPTTESPANSCNQYCGNSMPPDGTCYYDSECTSGAIAALMLMITVHLNRRAALG